MTAGSGEKFFFRALTIVVCVDLVVGHDVGCCKIWTVLEASCVFDVKVGKLNHLERNQIWLLTVNTAGIVWLTVQHNMIVRVSFMYYPGDSLGQTSADVIFLEEGLVYI
jgi:hypothetical protein